jgi:hypothetical protein
MNGFCIPNTSWRETWSLPALTLAVLVSHHGTAWKELARELANGVDAPGLPEAEAVCADAARPGYTTIDATEFKDSPPCVLDAKVIQGQTCCVTGAPAAQQTC